MHIDPRPFTLRQLTWMSEGRDQHIWCIASAVMCVIHNSHCDSKSKTRTPDDFNPTLTKKDRRRNAILITDDNIDIMRDEFKRAYDS